MDGMAGAGEKTEIFETMPIPAALAKMAVPTIVSQLITLVYNVADTWFIGQTNNPYMVAASSLVLTVFLMTTSIANLFGVGGGTLLLIYLTSFANVEQITAQGINLLYFLPAAVTALPSHIKNGYIKKEIALPAIGAGLLCSAFAAWIATALDVELLRKCFGVFLLYIGTAELFRKAPKTSGDHPLG